MIDDQDRDLRQEIDDLRRQVGRLNALQRIHAVKYRYFHIMDQFLVGEIGNVFTRDCRALMGPFGAINGREEMIAFFEGKVFPAFSMMIHCGHNPQIELTSDTTARGHWIYECYQISADAAHPGVWLCGLYTDEYAVEDGEWRISSTQGAYYFNTDVRDFWRSDRYSAYPPGAPSLPPEFRIQK